MKFLVPFHESVHSYTIINSRLRVHHHTLYPLIGNSGVFVPRLQKHEYILFALTCCVCTFKNTVVLNNSSYSEEINGTECILLSALSCFIAVIKKAWILLVEETRMSFKAVFLSVFASGCPPCMWRCNGHGNGALHPGGSCLRHQPLLLRLHPERSQVHLPQEVCTCSLQPSVTS